jgi:hypothetical protein
MRSSRRAIRLTDAMLERMVAGVSTRRDTRTGEPVGSEIEAMSHACGTACSRDDHNRG